MKRPEELKEQSARVHEPSPLHGDLQAEYFKIVDIVTAFDQRLLTIKGWGVTLSLASIGIGFQQRHYGLFLVAAISGLAFWLVEGVTKIHQMRYYPRMGDIEVAAYNLYRADTEDGPVSSPLIDWGWYTAGPRVRGGPARETQTSHVAGRTRSIEMGRSLAAWAPSHWPIHTFSFRTSSRSPSAPSYF